MAEQPQDGLCYWWSSIHGWIMRGFLSLEVWLRVISSSEEFRIGCWSSLAPLTMYGVGKIDRDQSTTGRRPGKAPKQTKIDDNSTSHDESHGLDGKTENFELFEDLFHTMIKIATSKKPDSKL